MYLEKCNERQRQEIYQEFNITEESLKRDVNYLMEWMEKQPHLPNVKDKQFLSHLLIHKKNSLEKTKKYLDFYYCTKVTLPVLFTKRDPTDNGLRIAFNFGVSVPLPKLTPEGYRVLFYRPFPAKDSHLLTGDDYMKLNYMIAAIMRREDLVKKYIFIYDFPTIDMNLITTMFNAGRKYLNVSENLNTGRIHKIHIIFKTSPAVNALLNLIKSLTKKKIVDKMVIWNDERPDLTSMFPAEILPEEYGGKEKPLEQLHEMYYQYICGFRDWLISEESVVADLSKRTDDLYKTSIHESVDGSFRQLVID